MSEWNEWPLFTYLFSLLVKDHYDCSLLHVCIQLSWSMLYCNV